VAKQAAISNLELEFNLGSPKRYHRETFSRTYIDGNSRKVSSGRKTDYSFPQGMFLLASFFEIATFCDITACLRADRAMEIPAIGNSLSAHARTAAGLLDSAAIGT
jgi:hypothetical protein